jgi:hypothetical protein
MPKVFILNAQIRYNGKNSQNFSLPEPLVKTGLLKKLMPRFKKMIKKNRFLKIQKETSAVG